MPKRKGSHNASSSVTKRITEEAQARGVAKRKESEALTTKFEKIYFSFSNPGGYGGKKRFLEQVKSTVSSDKGVINAASDWIDKVPTYNSFRPALKKGRKFTPQKTIVPRENHTLQTDLAELPAHKSSIGGYKYVLVFIDVFSRFVHLVPLLNKMGKTVADATRVLLNSLDKKPQFIQSDLGSEYKSAHFQTLMRDEGIKWYHSENRLTKASIAERFIRTMREKLARYTSTKKRFSYPAVLRDISTQYNSTMHSSIGVAPIDVGPQIREDIFHKLYSYPVAENLPNKSTKIRLSEGDRVKVSKIKGVFEKGSSARWSDEIFIVQRVEHTLPITYKLVDLLQREIKGKWYDYELFKLPKSSASEDLFNVEYIIKKRRRNGQVEYLCKFEGYSHDFNSWIPEKNLQEI